MPFSYKCLKILYHLSEIILFIFQVKELFGFLYISQRIRDVLRLQSVYQGIVKSIHTFITADTFLFSRKYNFITNQLLMKNA